MLKSLPKLYKTEKLDINGETVEIRGYRYVDEEYVVPLRSMAYDVSIYQKQFEDLTGLKFNETLNKKMDEDNLTVEQLQGIREIGQKIEEVRGKLEELQSKLAQRGLKRYYFKTNRDVEEYIRQVYMETDEDLNPEELEGLVKEEMEKFQELQPGSADWIDMIPDIDIDMEDAALISNIMLKQTNSRSTAKGGEKRKKSEGPAGKRNSRTSAK